MSFLPSSPAPRSSRPRGTRGFTLIELLVVLTILAVLLTLAAPRYFAQIASAKRAVLHENLRLTRDVIHKFYADTGRYPESLEELVTNRYLTALPHDPFTESSTTWILTPPPTGYEGAVYDLHSGAPEAETGGAASSGG